MVKGRRAGVEEITQIFREDLLLMERCDGPRE